MKTGRKVATAEEVSVAKGENLVANATDMVAMSSPVSAYSFKKNLRRGMLLDPARKLNANVF